ncbi:GNAT family N-acetyltransferase [Pseudaestuariivita rosea]|uniref:GNAT family N-acetyltransferase n=1 Tax=Pseudaestuariivita rosea TaxID=2763263 RepID=UPI001ABADB22|nr:GNAT family N-acetyltransferase [Pseudaestuariivita rosea]
MIRPAATADIEFISALQNRPDYLSMIAADHPDQLRSYRTDPSKHLLIFQIDDTPAGFLLLSIGGSQGVVELRRCALVKPGHGLGTLMLSELKHHVFRTLEAHRLWFDVAADNTRARRAYEKAGFVCEGALRHHWKRRSGDYADLALYGMLRDEYDA